MSLAIGTLCLNEMEWLPKLYEQHKDWPTLRQWVFVEAADVMYAQANPQMVNQHGLSTDGTTEYLESLAKSDSRVIHIKHGFSKSSDPAQGKCEARQRYLDGIHDCGADTLLTLDADEFYCLADQSQVLDLIQAQRGFSGYTFRYRNIWRPPSIANLPLMDLEVVGKFWSILVCKWWRVLPGITYNGNHNSPSVNGKPMNRNLYRFDRVVGTPEFVHMGFASVQNTRQAKNRYYVERGEGTTDHRGAYVKSRASFEWWTPGMVLPNGDRITKYDGPVPECFT